MGTARITGLYASSLTEQWSRVGPRQVLWRTARGRGSPAGTPEGCHRVRRQPSAHLLSKRCSPCPQDPKFPVVVSIRDLFDFRPIAVEAGESTVALGNRYPSSSRARELESCREGFRRADLLLCSSEMTKVEAEAMFPETPCTLVRDSVDASFWDPIRNPRERSMLGDFSDEEKCLIVSVGEKDPRWRSHFVSEVVSLIPTEVRARPEPDEDRGWQHRLGQDRCCLPACRGDDLPQGVDWVPMPPHGGDGSRMPGTRL